MFAELRPKMTGIIELWLQEHCGAWVDVEIAGRVFGGRHGESPQQPREFQFSGDTLVILFNTTERLTVIRPQGLGIGRDRELIIQDGESATWEWHYYGRPQLAENRCREIYHRKGREVVLSSEGPMTKETEVWLMGRNPLVRLR